MTREDHEGMLIKASFQAVSACCELRHTVMLPFVQHITFKPTLDETGKSTRKRPKQSVHARMKFGVDGAPRPRFIFLLAFLLFTMASKNLSKHHILKQSSDDI